MHWKGRGDEKFCRYNELCLGWWSRASGCFKGQRKLDSSGLRAQCSKRRASFLLDFGVVSSSRHTWHNVLGWFVAWNFLTRWKQAMSCETLWELESHFRSPNKLPLPAPPFFPLHPINLQHLRGLLLLGWVLFLSSPPAQRSWARQGLVSFFQPQRSWLWYGSFLPPPPSAHKTDLSN